MGITRTDWSEHYTEGRGFRRLGDEEKSLLVEHAPAPEGGRALDVGCGTGEMSVYLASLGYEVDAVDAVDAALVRARADHPDAKVRWLCLDIERDDPAPLGTDFYDLVVFRLSVAFLADRNRVLHALGHRLREGGTVLVITPVAAHTSAEKRHIALDEDEISALTCGWTSVQRVAVGELAALVLRGPCAATVAMERSVPATGFAVAGALAVVTDEHGRVLLGWSKRGMWETPGGKIEGAESLDGAGVRELAEETGLHATGAAVVTILTDAAQGVPRVTAVIRIAGFTGTLTTAEPEKFTRWEWHDPQGLGCLGPVFTPSAQALNAVWPGIISGLPPVNAYPLAAELPPVPGEPAEAVRLRQKLADQLVEQGWITEAAVEAAFRRVPRHRFLPGVELDKAYEAADGGLVTKRDQHGAATSSVSAPWMQAQMLREAALGPGRTAVEIGSGGANAALMSEVVAPHGRIVSVDIDPFVTDRASRFLTETGYHDVRVVLGDGEHAAVDHVGVGAADAVIVTAASWDIPPAWVDVLADGGRLVVPLQLIHGYTWAITFEKRGSALVSRNFQVCGFVPMQGAGSRKASVVRVRGGEVLLRFADGGPADTSGLDAALGMPRAEVWTGLTVPGTEPTDMLLLHLATTLRGFCRLAVDKDLDTGVVEAPKGWDAAAVVRDRSLARLFNRKAHTSEDGSSTWEFGVHAYGPHADELATEIAEQVTYWYEVLRGAAPPVLTARLVRDLPARPETGLRAVVKKHCRLELAWTPRPLASRQRTGAADPLSSEPVQTAP